MDLEISFANIPRIKNKPFSKRVRENLLERNNKGRVCCFFGYFSPGQKLAREIWAKKVYEEMKGR